MDEKTPISTDKQRYVEKEYEEWTWRQLSIMCGFVHSVVGIPEVCLRRV